MVGDWILEVNGKDCRMDTFVKLLPKDTTAPIQLRIQRRVEVDEEAEVVTRPANLRAAPVDLQSSQRVVSGMAGEGGMVEGRRAPQKRPRGAE
jgi:hypothetical protein